jgi:hypothetical protein
MLPEDDPRLCHAVDLRDPAGPRGGHLLVRRSEPEHRIDRIGVLVARRG